MKVFTGAPKAKRQSERSGGLRSIALYTGFAGLLGTNVLTLVGFLMAPDIAGLMSGQNELVFAAYEDRIAQLRIEVDRLHSRQYAQAGDLNLQLQELTQQQEVLIEQHHYVKLLAERAAELGIRTADLPADPTPAPTLVTSSLSYGAVGDAAADVAATATVIETMMSDSRLALAAISGEAAAATDEIVDQLNQLGIRAELPVAAMGGPFVPARDDLEEVTIVDDANAVMEALTRLKVARGLAEAAPIHRPISTKVRMSSSYGNRKDPFTGRKAFHAGVDFPSPTGTTVMSAGDGKVSFAGRRSGYGNVVEITHGDGLMTRYAHLSAFLVKEGQKVTSGTPIARVGSTGRSTGPHLHFEVRRDGTPLDPTRYLSTGKRLLRFT